MTVPTTVEEALFARLTGTAAVAALVAARVYPLVAPQAAARPFVTYQRISTSRVASLDGPSGLARVRYQLDVWADDDAGARALAREVRLALDGYSGDGAAGDRVIQSVVADDERDFFDEASRTFRVSADFIIWHAE